VALPYLFQELETFTKKVNVLHESRDGFSDELFVHMVAELVQQFELLSTAYQAHSEAEDQIVFPMLTTRISNDVRETFSCCSDEHECESVKFAAVGKLISQLKLENPNAGAEVPSRAEVLKDLKVKAKQLKSSLLDHMWKEDTLLLPIIVKSFTPKELSTLVQNIMAIRPAETVQNILQLMANKSHRDATALSAGPKIPDRLMVPPKRNSPSPSSIPMPSSTGSSHNYPQADNHTQPAGASGASKAASNAALITAPPPAKSLESPAILMGAGFKAPTTFQRWAPADDRLLQAAVGRHHCKNWKKIAESIPGRNGVQCYHRYPIPPSLLPIPSPPLLYHRWHRLKLCAVKGNFTREEDHVLMSMAGDPQPSNNWREIASLLPGRSGKQCRDRWCNVLDPRRKRSKWTQEEDAVVLEAYQRLGNSWAAIQQLLPGRTQLQVRDRLRTIVRRSQASARAGGTAGAALAGSTAGRLQPHPGGPLRTPAQNTAFQQSQKLKVDAAAGQFKRNQRASAAVGGATAVGQVQTRSSRGGDSSGPTDDLASNNSAPMTDLLDGMGTIDNTLGLDAPSDADFFEGQWQWNPEEFS
jgi:iron-sulfur cluster repair protein YtfE (RIC family)